MSLLARVPLRRRRRRRRRRMRGSHHTKYLTAGQECIVFKGEHGCKDDTGLPHFRYLRVPTLYHLEG